VLLVAGYAALEDLIAHVDRVPAAHEVAELLASPAASGQWLPGGTAPTVALAAAAEGASVRLWHPLPPGHDSVAGIGELRSAGIDLSHCPAAQSLARCILVTVAGTGHRMCWSTAAPDTDIQDPDELLEAADLVAICPQWGRWADSLARAAARRGIALALIGGYPPQAALYRWACAIVDHRQHQEAHGRFPVAVTVITKGADGCAVIGGDRMTSIPAITVPAVDATGAGDVFAGSYLARLMAGDDPAAASRHATQAAAAACLTWGARSATARAAIQRTAGGPTVPVRPSGPPEELLVRAEAALAALACGDALGMPNSFLRTPATRTGMDPAPADSPYHAGYPAGRVTDDTEQALALTRSIERSRGTLDPHLVAQELLAWFDSVGGEGSPAVGPSTMRALAALRAGQGLETAGITGTTNGAAMRIAPVGVWAALTGLDEAQLVKNVAAACRPTHNTSVAISGACAVAAAVASGVAGRTWGASVDAACRCADRGEQQGRWVYAPSVSARIRWAIQLIGSAASQDQATELISDLIGAGEPVIESVPAAFAAAAWAGCDPGRAILLAANCRGDTDTVAAIAGALSGAHSGPGVIPHQWRRLVAEVNQLDVSGWASGLAQAARRPADPEGAGLQHEGNSTRGTGDEPSH